MTQSQLGAGSTGHDVAWAAVDQTVLDRYAGFYRGREYGVTTIWRDGQKLFTDAPIPGSAGAVELLIDRLVDYKALVRRATAADLATVIDEALDGVRSVVIPAGLDATIAHACGVSGRSVTVDGRPQVLSPRQLDDIDVVVTAARVAIAISGTIILDGEADQGRRAITLVPDRHLVILHAHQVVRPILPPASGAS